MTYDGVDRLLSHFVAVAKEGGVTKAAKTLNISQPALSRNIRLLEQHLNVSLFDRHSVGVKLTACGQMLARRARLMQLEFEHALSEIENFKGGRIGQINIGAIPVWETIFIPEAISAAKKDLEGINFAIVGGANASLIPMLREGKVDLACLVLETQTYPDIVVEPLLDMERVVICSVDHPLAQQKTAQAKDLLEYPWTQIKDDEITFSRLGGYFSAYNLAPPNIDVECESNMSLLTILRSTNFLSTAPKPIVEHPMCEGLVVLPIQGSLWRYKTGIAYRKESTPPAHLNSFISYIRSYFLNEN